MASAEGPECRVCSEPFDDQNICPRVLSCGHSYCTGCLERLTIEDDKMSCPTCRVEVNLPPAGVAGLPKNFDLLSIINTNVTPHYEEGERLYTCEACSDEHPATSFCLNCQEDMCNLAAGFHTRNKASCDHKVVSLESSLVTVFCQEHKQRFRLFDEDCGHMVCRECIEVNHSGHNCSSLADVASKSRQDTHVLTSKVNACTKPIRDAEAQVIKANRELTRACEEQGAIIQSVFKELHAAVTAREQVLMNELDKLRKNKTVILTDQQSRLRKILEGTENAIQDVLSTIQSSAELLLSRSVLESMLRDIEKQSMVLVPEAECVPEFLFDPRELLKALDKTGIVYDKATCAETTCANGIGLISAYLGQEATFNITAHDAQKRKRTMGGDLFEVKLWNEIGEKKVDSNVKYQGDGSYLATYTVPLGLKSGKYTLSVRLRGAHIKDSPFTVRVQGPRRGWGWGSPTTCLDD